MANGLLLLGASSILVQTDLTNEFCKYTTAAAIYTKSSHKWCLFYTEVKRSEVLVLELRFVSFVYVMSVYRLPNDNWGVLILEAALTKECANSVIVLNFAFIFLSVLGVREITSG